MQCISFYKKINPDLFGVSLDPNVVKIIPISGGVDSSALAVLLHETFPDVDFVMVNTDTGAEEESTYEMLDKIEVHTGSKIVRLMNKQSLFDWIDEFKGYLPSSQSRWCTRILKLEIFQEWMEQYKGRQIQMFVGIRADESNRLAFSIEGCETVFPYISLGWDRNDVFSYASKTVGVARSYETRTRSGCTICPFVSRAEQVALLQRNPKEFKRGMSYEKMSEEDQIRHQEAIPLWKDSGLAMNWLGLPVPRNGSEINGAKCAPSGDLFGARGIFVGVEYFYDAMPGMEPFIWHQRFVSYSPTKGGLSRQLNSRFHHLLRVAEVYDMTPEDVRRNVKFGIFYIELDAGTFDTLGPTKGSYTWQSGSSYAQVRHIVQWAQRCLQADQLGRNASQTVKNELSVQYEWRESSQNSMRDTLKSGIEIGRVVAEEWFTPKEKEDELSVEDEVKLTPCPMCHI